MLKKLDFLDRVRKSIGYVIGNHKKELLLAMLLLILFAKIVAATIYNSMNIQSEVGVEPV